jgi:hypothetical protein
LHTEIYGQHKNLVSVVLHSLLDDLVQIALPAIAAKEVDYDKCADV